MHVRNILHWNKMRLRLYSILTLSWFTQIRLRSTCFPYLEPQTIQPSATLYEGTVAQDTYAAGFDFSQEDGQANSPVRWTPCLLLRGDHSDAVLRSNPFFVTKNIQSSFKSRVTQLNTFCPPTLQGLQRAGWLNSLCPVLALVCYVNPTEWLCESQISYTYVQKNL